jgi:hypothetical protein
MLLTPKGEWTNRYYSIYSLFLWERLLSSTWTPFENNLGLTRSMPLCIAPKAQVDSNPRAKGGREATAFKLGIHFLFVLFLEDNLGSRLARYGVQSTFRLANGREDS